MIEHKEWQDLHNSIPVPGGLDYRISKSIDQGSRVVRRRYMWRKTGAAAASLIIAFAVLIISINVSPVFAEQLTKLPGGQKFVQMVLLNADPTQGGDITDGGTVGAFTHHLDNTGESLSIALKNAGDETYSHYEVRYRDYPFSVELTLNGIRHWNPLREPYLAKGPALLRSVHSLMTLDDAASRILLVFNSPVIISTEEDRLQQTLTFIFTEAPSESVPPTEKYSLRTGSYPFEEIVGVIESMLVHEYGSPGARVIVDLNNQFVIEEGLYANEAQALERLSSLQDLGFEFPLHVESRTADVLPSAR